MGNAKMALLFSILCFLLMVELQVYSGGWLGVEGEGINCGSACNYRCSEASRHKMCIRACNTCCERCNCVPSGTSDHEDECPCYANMTTHGGRHKCP